MTSFAAFAEEYFAAPAAHTPRREAMPQSNVGAVDALAFRHALTALAATLAAVNGVPGKAEYLAFVSLFVAEDAADEARLRSLFVKHVNARSSALQYARQLAALTTHQPVLRNEIFVRLIRVATADGMLNAAEIEWLRAVGKVFGLPASQVCDAIGQCFTAGGQSPYALLGVDARVGDAALRRAYMEKVHALHPDRYQAAGASADTIAMLSQQLAAVNAAYESVCKGRTKKTAFSGAVRRWVKNARSARADKA